MTNLITLLLTWLACWLTCYIVGRVGDRFGASLLAFLEGWLFGPTEPEDEPQPELHKLMTEHYERRGMCVIAMEDRGQTFAIAYTPEHAVEALTRGELMVKAMVWEAAGRAEVRIE